MRTMVLAMAAALHEHAPPTFENLGKGTAEDWDEDSSTPDMHPRWCLVHNEDLPV
ncbi:hypothetical protein [Falsirhodobacter xinxiangensis]|uniref:hypothetical protein n=1 Tax=Falsirhodobacter xinxiangensis TaxID=2530049 RepID=UPI00145B7EC5|nr:hypothetical protein [Rhodobacter xinxiangensis]